jgi:hypothetical protein
LTFHFGHGHVQVSGQLEGETMACALGSIYTFGPTFRAENSLTSRHLAGTRPLHTVVIFIGFLFVCLFVCFAFLPFLSVVRF